MKEERKKSWSTEQKKEVDFRLLLLIDGLEMGSFFQSFSCKCFFTFWHKKAISFITFGELLINLAW